MIFRSLGSKTGGPKNQSNICSRWRCGLKCCFAWRWQGSNRCGGRRRCRVCNKKGLMRGLIDAARRARCYLPARPGAFPLLPRFSIFLIFELFPRLPLLPRFSIFLIFELFPWLPRFPRSGCVATAVPCCRVSAAVAASCRVVIGGRGRKLHAFRAVLVGGRHGFEAACSRAVGPPLFGETAREDCY